MDIIDYQKRLGLSFNNFDLQKMFIQRIKGFLDRNAHIPFTEEHERNFCYQVGIKCKIENKSLFDIDWENEPRGLQRLCLYINDLSNDFISVLSYMVVFYNTYSGRKADKKIIFIAIKEALKDSHIMFDVYSDNDGAFIFPKGAKELDDALISEPLEWLSYYPKSQKTFITALKQYSDGIYIRDVADNLRKALEEFLQEFLKNTKNLETNKNEICKYLGEHGVDAGITGLFHPLINTYKNINDRIAKHNDAVDAKMLEFLMYQTGILIRMVLTVQSAEKDEEYHED